MQIINPTPNFGQSFGEALGQGLGAGLQALAEGKLQQIHRRNREKALESTFGPELARTLSYLNPQEFGTALKYMASQGAGQQQMSGMPSYEDVQASYLLGRQPQQQMISPQPVTQPVKPRVQTVVTGQTPELNRPTAQPQAQAAAQKQATMQQLGGSPIAQMPLVGTPGIKVTPELITQQGPQNVSKVGMVAPVKKTGPLTVQEFKQIQQSYPMAQQPSPVAAIKQPQERPAPSAKAIQLAYKQNKPFLDEISKSAKEARENNMRLQRIEELDKTGNLQSPAIASVLEALHLDFPSFMSKESQELKKLSSDFVKGAKSIFGSRITNADLKVFMNTVPTLTQTKEGRAAVIRNWKMFNEGTIARERATNDIIEENGGVPPINLKQKVEERIAPELDAISQRFILGDEQKFEVGQTLKSLPKNPSVGMVLESPKGDIKWNGKSWVKA